MDITSTRASALPLVNSANTQVDRSENAFLNNSLPAHPARAVLRLRKTRRARLVRSGFRSPHVCGAGYRGSARSTFARRRHFDVARVGAPQTGNLGCG